MPDPMPEFMPIPNYSNSFHPRSLLYFVHSVWVLLWN